MDCLGTWLFDDSLDLQEKKIIMPKYTNRQLNIHVSLSFKGSSNWKGMCEMVWEEHVWDLNNG